MRSPARTSNALRYPLDEILGSEGNVRLLRLFADEVSGPLNAPDAAERSGLTVPGARKALGRLVRSGMVVRLGAGRSQQYALNDDQPLATPLRGLFRAERMRHEALTRVLRDVFGDVGEVIAAWIDVAPTAVGDPLDVWVLVETTAMPWVRDELRTRLAHVEHGFDQVIELDLRTDADVPPTAPDTAIPLAGVVPREPLVAETRPPARHSEREERALRMSHGIADLLRRDPSMVKRALDHIDRLLAEDQGAAANDLYEWGQILRTYSTERMAQFMVSGSSRADRLRQSSPFFAVLTAAERDRLTAYLEDER